MGNRQGKALTTLAATAAMVGSTLVVPALATSAQATTEASSPQPRAATCSSGLLPAEVLGRPTGLRAGAPTGIWFWHDGSRYHLRATDDRAPGTGGKAIRGSITSTGKINSVRGVKLEGNDSFAVSRPSRKKMTFRFANSARIDGLTFKASCRKAVTLKASIGGNPIQISVGKDPLVLPAENRTGASSYEVVPTTPLPAGCPNGRLPETVLGSNGEVRNRPASARLWHDGSGFQFRVTHDEHQPNGRGAQKTFRGSITTTTRFFDVRLVKLEPNDQLFVRRPAPNKITFELRNYTGVDGLRFRTGCGDITLNVSVDGAPAQIQLGKTPTDVPLPAPPATESSVVIARSA